MEDVPNHTVGITQVHRGHLLFLFSRIDELYITFVHIVLTTTKGIQI